MQRCVGLELEFASSRIQIGMTDLHRNLNDFAQRHNYRVSTEERSDTWTLKTDHCGYELTSPAFNATASNFAKIKSVIDRLKEICYQYRNTNLPQHQNTCSPSCGMHVHVNIDDFNFTHMKNLINVFHTYENALLSIQAPSRRDNNFVLLLQHRLSPSIRNNHRTINDIIVTLSDHYCAVNFGRYNERGTMEVRYASSTVTGQKAINWIQLLVYLTEIAKRDENIEYRPEATIDNLKEFIMTYSTGTWIDGRRATLLRWIDKRIEQLATYQTAREERREQNRIRNENN